MISFFKIKITASLIALFFLINNLTAQELYRMNTGRSLRFSSFENPAAEKGAGGKENETAKGHAFDLIRAGESKILINYKGTGIIQRLWFTLSNRSPIMLRSMRIQFFWDNASVPAVDVPFGDFFGIGLGQKQKFESALFSDPEGKSFNCLIPMPFKQNAKVVLINDSKEVNTIFYDIDFQLVNKLSADDLYFHAFWNRQITSPLKMDFEILPLIKGKGRFLGTNIGVITDSSYTGTWWGEGEVKMYIDGDSKYPTMNGTGTEDYIGTAYGMGLFNHQYQGCLVADDKKGMYAFYRYHIKDEIFFNQNIRVTIQQIGGGDTKTVMGLLNKAILLQPVSVSSDTVFLKLLELKSKLSLNDKNYPDGWMNFYRSDDYSATSYFYLDAPVHLLPQLQTLQKRIHNIK
jgi:Protein of unknown function (DUF2961)